MLHTTKTIHFFVGLACAAIALPFGILAAALLPVLLGFSKQVYFHFTRRNADSGKLGWVTNKNMRGDDSH